MEPDQLQLLTDQSINLAGAGANSAWWVEARAALKFLCERGTPFTTDAMWYLLDHSTVKTRDPRASGALIRAACKDGLIRRTGEYHNSIRKECHRRPLAVWMPTKGRHV